MTRDDATLTVTDCSSLQLRSWHGDQPRLDEIEIPMQWAGYRFPDGFWHEFNRNSISAMQSKAVQEKLPSTDNACYVSPFLFFCPNIHPRAVSQYFLSKPTEMRSLFFYYFSAPNLDFMPLDDACRLLFSRIAFPEDMNNLLNIFIAFADAYLVANDYITFNAMDIVRLAIAAVVISMSKRKSENLSVEEFKKLVETVNAPEEFKLSFYESIKEKPIILFFTAMTLESEPDLEKTGCFMVEGGALKRKKKLFCKIKDEGLVFFRDDRLNDEYIVLPLHNVAAKMIVQGKDQVLSIYSNDSMPFGYKYKDDKKSKKKMLKTNQHEFFPVSEMDGRTWQTNINLAAFSLTLRKLATEHR